MPRWLASSLQLGAALDGALDSAGSAGTRTQL